MYALIDCDSFFASVERVFHPGLRGKPVCVLSSNDGIIVALTKEAKAAGLRRGDPIFKVRDTIEKSGAAVFSTNMMLYAAMSKRVVSIIRQSVDKVENYSIDESFADLSGYEENYDIEEYMRALAERIGLWTDIPVSIGVAPTKTLAKMASKFAKNYKGYRKVCMIDSDEKRLKALELFDLADVWGIGRRNFSKLASLGVTTPLQLASKNPEWVARHFPKPMIQTWMELNGKPCIRTDELSESAQITVSRSFGEMVSSKESVRQSIVAFAASCANKLRAQRSVAGSVTVFLLSNRFREDLEQYGNAASVRFPVRTSDTIEITEGALAVADTIFRPGIMYKKTGVILGDIAPDSAVQQNLFFDHVEKRAERLELSRTMDEINCKYGLKTVSLAAEGGKGQPWKVKSEMRSPNFLTDLDDILSIGI